MIRIVTLALVALTAVASRGEGQQARRRADLRVGDGYVAGRAWVAVGDSVAARVNDVTCHLDLCGALPRPATFAWVVDDTAVAALRTPDPTHRPTGRARLLHDPHASWITGRREGRTMVRALGVPALRPTAIEVMVTRPVTRLSIEAESTRVRVGDQVRFRVRAFDASGVEVEGVPAWYAVLVAANSYRVGDPASATHTFAAPGPAVVLGRLGTLVDTLRLVVEDSAR